MGATTQPLLRAPKSFVDLQGLWQKLSRVGIPLHADDSLAQKIIVLNLTNLLGI